MKRKIIALIVLTFIFSFNIIFVETILAAPKTTSTTTTSTVSLVPQGTKYNTGDYELNDFVQVGVNVTKIILGTVGSLSLLMFVYGGVMMLISAGNSEQVSKAKGIIMAAIIGLVIVFVSYIIVSFVISALGAQNTAVGNWNSGGIKIYE
jgi:hypothetical protein